MPFVSGVSEGKLTVMRELLGVGSFEPISTEVLKTVFKQLSTAGVASQSGIGSGVSMKGLRGIFGAGHNAPQGEAVTLDSDVPPAAAATPKAGSGTPVAEPESPSPPVTWFENSAVLFATRVVKNPPPADPNGLPTSGEHVDGASALVACCT